MRPSDQEKRGKLLNFVSQLFRDLSSATQSDQRTDRRLAMVARDLSGLPPKFRRIDSTAGAVLTDALAAEARRVSTLLPKLEIRGQAQAKHAFDLIGALQEFEDTTSMIAQGIPGSHGLRGKRAAALERQLGEFRRQSGDFGFQLRMSADLLRFSLGLPPLPNGFEYPRATGGCG